MRDILPSSSTHPSTKLGKSPKSHRGRANTRKLPPQTANRAALCGYIVTRNWKPVVSRDAFQQHCWDQHRPFAWINLSRGEAEIEVDVEPARRRYPDDVDAQVEAIFTRYRASRLHIGEHLFRLEGVADYLALEAMAEMLQFALEYSEPVRQPTSWAETRSLARAAVMSGSDSAAITEAQKELPPPPLPSPEFMRLAEKYGVPAVRIDQRFTDDQDEPVLLYVIGLEGNDGQASQQIQ